jgi:beta-phosphoglucomutase-like phosphatase (HAD superfamily)
MKMARKKGGRRSQADPFDLAPIDGNGKIQGIIETPKGSRNKYAFDSELRVFSLKKVLPAGMTFPYDSASCPRKLNDRVRTVQSRQESPRHKDQQAKTPPILFDLDGTLMDTNYEHLAAWRLALQRVGVEAPNAFLHRCVGMRGDLLLKAVHNELGKKAGHEVAKLDKLHKAHFEKTLPSVKPLPDAVALLKFLTRHKISWAIATGGDKNTVSKMARPLGLPPAALVVTAHDVDKAKPEPDVFLVAARRAKALGIGLLSGGYGEIELTQAGAYRVYKHSADLLNHLAEIGIDAR